MVATWIGSRLGWYFWLADGVIISRLKHVIEMILRD